MYSANVEIVKWEKAVDRLPDDRPIHKLTVRRVRQAAGSEAEARLSGAFAIIDGNKILGASMYIEDGNDLYTCFFDTDVDFTVGSICTVTWERYFEWVLDPDPDSDFKLGH